jgi:ATP synthase protein I
MNNSETSISTIEPTDQTEVSTSEVTDNSMGEFYQLRNNLFIGTIVIAVVSSALTWWFYGQQTSLNYLLGTCFSLVYVNMLVREVERVGRFKKGIGSTRLAVFVGLIIVATQRQQLQVIPIFLGFMTYKAAILFYILPTSLLGNLNKSKQKS